MSDVRDSLIAKAVARDGTLQTALVKVLYFIRWSAFEVHVVCAIVSGSRDPELTVAFLICLYDEHGRIRSEIQVGEDASVAVAKGFRETRGCGRNSCTESEVLIFCSSSVQVSIPQQCMKSPNDDSEHQRLRERQCTDAIVLRAYSGLLVAVMPCAYMY